MKKKTKRLVVYSFSCGEIKRFPDITYTHPEIDYVMFTDAVSIPTNGWTVINIKIPEDSTVYDCNKQLKWSPNELFGGLYEYSIYTDCVTEFVSTPWDFLAKHMEHDICGFNLHKHGKMANVYDEISGFLTPGRGKGNIANIWDYKTHLDKIGFDRTIGYLEATMVVTTLGNKTGNKLEHAILDRYFKIGTYRDQLVIPEVMTDCGHTVDDIGWLGCDLFRNGTLRVNLKTYVRHNDQYLKPSGATVESMLQWFALVKESVMKRLEYKICVSMTTYPVRINHAITALKNLMTNQLLLADEYVLWLATEEFPDEIPKDLESLVQQGLTIRFVKNTGPYKRYNAFKEYSDSYIVFVDDDIYYPCNFIESMKTCSDEHPGSVICYATDTHRFNNRVDAALCAGPNLINPNNSYKAGVALWPPHVVPQEIRNDIDIGYELLPHDDQAWIEPWLVYYDICIVATTELFNWKNWNIYGSQDTALNKLNWKVDSGVTVRMQNFKKMIDQYPELGVAWNKRYPNFWGPGSITHTEPVCEVSSYAVAPGLPSVNDDASTCASRSIPYVKILKSWKPTTTGITLPIR